MPPRPSRRSPSVVSALAIALGLAAASQGSARVAPRDPSALVDAPAPPGLVRVLRGDVQVRTGNDGWRVAELDDAFASGDTVRTLGVSHVSVELSESWLATLGSDTELRFRHARCAEIIEVNAGSFVTCGWGTAAPARLVTPGTVAWLAPGGSYRVEVGPRRTRITVRSGLAEVRSAGVERLVRSGQVAITGHAAGPRLSGYVSDVGDHLDSDADDACRDLAPAGEHPLTRTRHDLLVAVAPHPADDVPPAEPRAVSATGRPSVIAIAPVALDATPRATSGGASVGVPGSLALAPAPRGATALRVVRGHLPGVTQTAPFAARPLMSSPRGLSFARDVAAPLGGAQPGTGPVVRPAPNVATVPVAPMTFPAPVAAPAPAPTDTASPTRAAPPRTFERTPAARGPAVLDLPPEAALAPQPVTPSPLVAKPAEAARPANAGAPAVRTVTPAPIAAASRTTPRVAVPARAGAPAPRVEPAPSAPTGPERP